MSNEPIQRRTLEDEFVRQFRAAGDVATASYTAIPANGQAEKSLLIRTIEDTGVDAVLITRIVRGTGYSPGWGTWARANAAKGRNYYDDYADGGWPTMTYPRQRRPTTYPCRPVCSPSAIPKCCGTGARGYSGLPDSSETCRGSQQISSAPCISSDRNDP